MGFREDLGFDLKQHYTFLPQRQAFDNADDVRLFEVPTVQLIFFGPPPYP